MLIKKPRYDLIFSDNNMPGMNGIDFFEDIEKKGCKLNNARKALFTGYVSHDLCLRARHLG